jgi:hypothetical protein
VIPMYLSATSLTSTARKEKQPPLIATRMPDAILSTRMKCTLHHLLHLEHDTQQCNHPLPGGAIHCQVVG